MDESTRGGATHGESDRIRDLLLKSLAEAPGHAFDVGKQREGVPEPPKHGGGGQPMLHVQATVPPDRTPMLLTEEPGGFLSWVMPTNHEEVHDHAHTTSRGAGRGTEELVATFEIPMFAPSQRHKRAPGDARCWFLRVQEGVPSGVGGIVRPIHEEGRRTAGEVDGAVAPPRRTRLHAGRLSARGVTLARRVRTAGDPAGRECVALHPRDEQSQPQRLSPVAAGVHASHVGSLPARVIAFDHPTLSVDPGDNRSDLPGFLPAGLDLQLDIVAHSSRWSRRP